MLVRILSILCILLLLSSCTQSLPVTSVEKEELGLETLPLVPPSSSSQFGELSTGEQVLTEEEPPQVDQMNKDQVSKTYTYLKDEFEDGVFYLSFTEQRSSDSSYGKKEYLIASDGNSLLIRDNSLRFSYLICGQTLTVMNDKEKVKQSFSLEGTQFSFENYLDWHHWSSYEMVEFTAVRAGTQKRPKLTETFLVQGGEISFYYYKDVLSTVSGNDTVKGQWQCTINSIHGEPKASLFEIPANYSEKNVD